MKALILISILCFLLGFFVGAYLPPFNAPAADQAHRVDPPSDAAAGTVKQTPRNSADLADMLTNPPEAFSAMRELNFQDKRMTLQEVTRQGGLESVRQSILMIDQLSKGDIVALIEHHHRASAFGNPATHQQISLLASALFERDPDRAVEMLASNLTGHGMSTLEYAIMLNLAAGDPHEGIRVVQEALTGQALETAISVMLHSMVGVHSPQDVLGLYRDLEIPTTSAQHNWPLQQIYYHWAEEDAAAALADIETNLRGDARRNALTGYYTGLAETDPRAAAQSALASPHPNEQNTATQTVFSRWLVNDQAAALDYLAGIEDTSQRNRLIERLSWQIAQVADEATLPWVEANLSGNARHQVVSRIISEIAKEDPRHAASLAEQLPFGQSYNEAISNIARQWASQDSATAYRWVESLPRGNERDNAFTTVLLAFSRQDPEAALKFIASEVQENQAGHIERISRRLGSDTHLEAFAYIEQIQDEALYTAAHKGVISGWAQQAPGEVAAFLQSEGLEDMLNDMASNIAGAWSRSAPEEAAAWAQALEDGDARRSAIDQVARNWLNQNTYVASEWIGTLEAGREKDSAISHLISTIEPAEPAAAFVWASEINNERQRQRQTRRILNRQFADDPDAGRTLINESSLSRSEKESLQKLFE